MATFVYIDPVITINSVDLTDHITKATLKIDVEDKETTAFGSAWKTRLGGLKEGTVELEFNQDFAASEVDATIWPLLGSVTAITIKPTSGSTAATNPLYSGNVLVKEYAPLDGSVGDVAKTSVSWPTSGAVARATS
ncbi:hypothetical protein Aph01nite_59230 [Acrocarpospora phusangensis]|uniref:Phage tail protein n=1 Tax=Acrocarpospora phusangensis TaxID=1070424 RepID=A0A919QHD8_9ACTN|nr:hypothetical protein [Acrocarpospora phusangensis]GIH27613.1 hypothetical protein Aph01nite_59230 [Acrocarpospora phusangensis]